jgi:hypothetical protein
MLSFDLKTVIPSRFFSLGTVGGENQGGSPDNDVPNDINHIT